MNDYQNYILSMIICCFFAFVVCRYLSFYYIERKSKLSSSMFSFSIFFGILSIVVGGYMLIMFDTFNIELSFRITYYASVGVCALFFIFSKRLAKKHRISRTAKILSISDVGNYFSVFFTDETTFFTFIGILKEDEISLKAYKEEKIIFINNDDAEKVAQSCIKLEELANQTQ